MKFDLKVMTLTQGTGLVNDKGWDLNPGSLVLDHYMPRHLPFNIFMLPIKCDAQAGIWGFIPEASKTVIVGRSLFPR